MVFWFSRLVSMYIYWLPVSMMFAFLWACMEMLIFYALVRANEFCIHPKPIAACNQALERNLGIHWNQYSVVASGCIHNFSKSIDIDSFEFRFGACECTKYSRHCWALFFRSVHVPLSRGFTVWTRSTQPWTFTCASARMTEHAWPVMCEMTDRLWDARDTKYFRIIAVGIDSDGLLTTSPDGW